MDNYVHKTLITEPHKLTYSYYLSPNFASARLSPSVPTLLFVHGFPDEAFMWSEAISHFSDLPYPIIVLDILGMGGSSKPADPALYIYRKQADSIAQILDHENASNNIIPIGHDWGSALSQRFYLHHKSRCVGLSLTSLAYQVPSADEFSLDAANAATTKTFGYPQWKYWEFFTAPDAPNLLRENLDRFWQANNGYYPSALPDEHGRDIWMREIFCTDRAFREYITATGRYAGYTVALKPYAEDPALQRRFVERLSRDGLEGPVNYYHTLKDNLELPDDRSLAGKPGAAKIEVPLLYIGQTGDWVCRSDLMGPAKDKGLVPQLEEHVVEAGHWVLYEKPAEIAALLKGWLSKNFPVSA